MSTLKRLQNKLDRIAIDQLRAEVVRLNQELEETKQELRFAQQAAYDADRWQDLAMDLIYEAGQQIGMTKEGDFGLLRKEH